MSMNRITLSGYVGADAKRSTSQAGKEITKFSLATTKRYQDGEVWKERTQWHDCVVYGASLKAAENIQKGAHLLVEGELSYRDYERTIETESGPVKVKWPVTEVIVYSVEHLNPKSVKQDRGAA